MRAVNDWKAACLQFFAQAEEAVTEALIALNEIERGATEIGLRHYRGQKLEDLGNAIGPCGLFADKGKMASNALMDFRIHDNLRIHLAHSVTYVLIEGSGDWIIVFRHLALQDRKSRRETLMIDKADAIALQEELRRKTQSLIRNLTNLVKPVGS